MNKAHRLAIRISICALALSLLACATQENKIKTAIEEFKQNTTGQYQSAVGAELFVVPVRARMVTDEAIYIERRDANGTFGRLLNLEWSADSKKIIQRALTFTQEGQWRDLRENPELFNALLPKDVRPAGTCDLQASSDMNSLSYSCGGSPPEIFRRK
jgi:hypothetical protein